MYITVPWLQYIVYETRCKDKTGSFAITAHAGERVYRAAETVVYCLRKDDTDEKALQGPGFGGSVCHVFGAVCRASDFDGIAQELKDVGLFQGTDTGFELDRAPTRAESAVMLVRLLGAEETAKAELEAGETAHPFTDVPEWAKAHVAWLYTNKLTNGISETEFGSDSLCNAQMYCTFVLRALGYSDGEGGQFAYGEAVSFAAEKVYTTPPWRKANFSETMWWQCPTRRCLQRSTGRRTPCWPS